MNVLKKEKILRQMSIRATRLQAFLGSSHHLLRPVTMSQPEG